MNSTDRPDDADTARAAPGEHAAEHETAETTSDGSSGGQGHPEADVGEHAGGGERSASVATPEPAVDASSREVPSSPARLHQPWRWWVLAIEIVVVAALVTAAVWLWRRGELPTGASRQYLGDHLTASTAVATMAGLVLLDGLRQLTLAVRIRGRR